ncbi:unnamed protein product [Phytomonas sp. Hart1]|nr:unnamed protein product [Phytomonas sp. Hart1]|eukprot:CCW67562.1 unnamed protein product [Phytomonas sp. isolate Hart1]
MLHLHPRGLGGLVEVGQRLRLVLHERPLEFGVEEAELRTSLGRGVEFAAERELPGGLGGARAEVHVHEPHQRRQGRGQDRSLLENLLRGGQITAVEVLVADLAEVIPITAIQLAGELDHRGGDLEDPALAIRQPREGLGVGEDQPRIPRLPHLQTLPQPL